MLYHQPISDEQLALFLEAVKLMTILADDVPPLIVKAIPEPYASQNETILVMHQALIAEAIKTNPNNAKEKKADEAEVKRKAEEAAVKKAAEEENERAMDVNSEGENKVDKDETLKSKSKKKTKSRPIVDSESEETEEVKAKRRKAKGKGKAIDPEYRQNTVPVDYTGCPGVPVHKICKGCKVLVNAWYQRPCVRDVQMDANDQIFYVRLKDHCFVCLMRNNVCSFTPDDKANFIMPEASDDEELQVKLKKLCDEQDAFKKQKDKEKAKRNKLLGNRPKAGTKKMVQVNVKASGSTPKSTEEGKDGREEVEEVPEEVEEVPEEDKEGREVEDDETMKDPEADKL
ncbi:hypothetical protein M422DRAFT_244115 [Sphaerobolus stellatus SS14]|nr:hypothetical protein M422DRAFT_244115 [Sphaerobolus stellatus SS14]